jgi:hypothetical protein
MRQSQAEPATGAHPSHHTRESPDGCLSAQSQPQPPQPHPQHPQRRRGRAAPRRGRGFGLEAGRGRIRTGGSLPQEQGAGRRAQGARRMRQSQAEPATGAHTAHKTRHRDSRDNPVSRDKGDTPVISVC